MRTQAHWYPPVSDVCGFSPPQIAPRVIYFATLKCRRRMVTAWLTCEAIQPCAILQNVKNLWCVVFWAVLMRRSCMEMDWRKQTKPCAPTFGCTQQEYLRRSPHARRKRSHGDRPHPVIQCRKAIRQPVNALYQRQRAAIDQSPSRNVQPDGQWRRLAQSGPRGQDSKRPGHGGGQSMVDWRLRGRTGIGADRMEDLQDRPRRRQATRHFHAHCAAPDLHSPAVAQPR